MRVLVLGGTRFLSREVTVHALARGHEVACACRGTTGPVPEGARHVPLDRAADTDPDEEPWADLARTPWDVVVDVASTPSWVRTAVRALGGDPHWVFVSTVSVYADVSRPGGTVDDTPLVAAAGHDLDDRADPGHYGANKVACEQLVRTASPGGGLVARPGLIVGPGDPSGRFTYWPVRMQRGGRVLAAAPRDAPVQVVDVRDLAAWLLLAAERRLTGTYDAVGPAQSREQHLAEVAAGVGASPDVVWAAPEDLLRLGVRPWAGDRALPVWLPPGEMDGMLARDVSATLQEGLRCRPLRDTARDTAAWVHADAGARVTGLTGAQEREVLQALAGEQDP